MTTTLEALKEYPVRSGNWLEKFARLGYASRAVIYVIIGSLALLTAFGRGGETTNAKGAISQILQAPSGWILVLFLAIGLVGYSMWRFCQAFFDSDLRGTQGKALVIRGAMFISGIAHALLAIWAGKVALGYASGGEGSGGSEDSLVAQLMAQPFGASLVGAVGLTLIGVGIGQLAKGHSEKFARRFEWDAATRRRWLPVCKFGLYARGVVFAIIGSFIVYAAITTNPENAGGIPEALDWLRKQAFGPWLLAVIAAGLVAFGAYSVVEAMYRRIRPPA